MLVTASLTGVTMASYAMPMLFAEVSPTPDMKQPSTASFRSVCLEAFLPSVICAAPLPREMEKPNLLLLTFSCARDALSPNAASDQPCAASMETLLTLTAPKELLTIFASVAVETVPSVPTAMGSTVGTVTLILVAAGSPPIEPSAVLDRVTEEVPVPPEASTVLAAEAPIVRLAIRQTARTRETIFLKFFMVKYSFVVLKI